jgi:hypothetical protein
VGQENYLRFFFTCYTILADDKNCRREMMLGLKGKAADRMIAHVNRKLWWHCPPQDPRAYEERGKFYASSFQEAEFWGRPLDIPERVEVKNPLVGDEKTIMTRLRLPLPKESSLPLEQRFAIDRRMKSAALKLGYDSILLMSSRGFARYKSSRKIPRSLELNVLEP